MNYRYGLLIIVVSLQCYVSATLLSSDSGSNNGPNTIFNFIPREMNNMSMEEFARNFVTKDNQPFNLKEYLNTDEFKQSVSANEEDVALASLDACGPRYRSVVFEADTDPRVFYWPPCTQALRCGGCCPSEMLECAPVEKQFETVMVMRVRIASPGSPVEFDNMQMNVVEHHTKCEPQCKVKESDCNLAIHDYLPQDCRCKCIVGDSDPSRPRCSARSQRWDERTCSCVCSAVDVSCNGFAEFSHVTCRCELRQSLRESVGGNIYAIANAARQNSRLPALPTLPTLPTLIPTSRLPTLPPLLPLSVPCSPPFPCLPNMVPRLVNGRCVCTTLTGRRRKREERRQKFLTIRRQKLSQQ